MFSAPVIVNAAGAWADRIAQMAGARSIGLSPLRRTVALASLPSGLDLDRCPLVVDAEEQFYFKPESGALLVSPCDETPAEPCDIQPQEIDVAIAVDRVQRATTLVVTRLTSRWAGLRSFVADRTPVVGFDPDLKGFFWLAGQGGYGIQTAPALSALAAGLIKGEAPPEGQTRGFVERLSPQRAAITVQRAVT